jgi:hypothetical protein
MLDIARDIQSLSQFKRNTAQVMRDSLGKSFGHLRVDSPLCLPSAIIARTVATFRPPRAPAPS